MTAIDLAGDIPHQVALQAHAGTSFVPEKRAEAAIKEYADTLQADFDILAKHANTDEKKATLDVEFARYRAGYKAKYLVYLGSRNGIMSTMITGASKFPVRRMEKKQRTVERRLAEMIEFRTRALAAITKLLRPELRPIMAGDANTIENLQKKLDGAEQRQAMMKAVNVAIRKNAKAGQDAQVQAMLAVWPNLGEVGALKLLQPDFAGRVGFVDYELTNNGTEIRRMKARITTLTAAKSTPETKVEGAGGVTVEDCPADNRVRLFFRGKPDEAVRTRLKGNGFRWTPTLGCWQAYRNPNSLRVAESFVQPQCS